MPRSVLSRCMVVQHVSNHSESSVVQWNRSVGISSAQGAPVAECRAPVETHSQYRNLDSILYESPCNDSIEYDDKGVSKGGQEEGGSPELDVAISGPGKSPLESIEGDEGGLSAKYFQ